MRAPLDKVEVQQAVLGALRIGLDDQIGVFVVAGGSEAGVARAILKPVIEPPMPVTGENVLDGIGVLVEQGADAVIGALGGRDGLGREVGREDSHGRARRWSLYIPHA